MNHIILAHIRSNFYFTKGVEGVYSDKIDEIRIIVLKLGRETSLLKINFWDRNGPKNNLS